MSRSILSTTHMYLTFNEKELVVCYILSKIQAWIKQNYMNKNLSFVSSTCSSDWGAEKCISWLEVFWEDEQDKLFDCSIWVRLEWDVNHVQNNAH